MSLRDIPCVECGRLFSKKGMDSHFAKMHSGRPRQKTTKGMPAWNKGLTLSDERVKRQSSSWKKRFKEIRDAGQWVNPATSPEARAALSEAAVARNLGGHTSKKRIWYLTKDGGSVHLHSSYEEMVARSLDESEVRWTRPPPLPWIDARGKRRRYYPDFFLPDYGVYLDPKNDFLILKDKIKIDSVSDQNSVEILVLSKDQLSWSSISTLLPLKHCGDAPSL